MPVDILLRLLTQESQYLEKCFNAMKWLEGDSFTSAWLSLMWIKSRMRTEVEGDQGRTLFLALHWLPNWCSLFSLYGNYCINLIVIGGLCSHNFLLCIKLVRWFALFYADSTVFYSIKAILIFPLLWKFLLYPLTPWSASYWHLLITRLLFLKHEDTI
jgi:hypothetical protein